MATDRNTEKDFSNVYKPKEIGEGFLSKKKQNKYHYTQVDLTKRSIPHSEVENEIAKTHDIPSSVVKTVLTAYTDIIRREIVANGRFYIPGVLEVYSRLWNMNHDKFEKVPNIEEEIYICPPTTVRPKVRLNDSMRDDYKNARRYEEAIAFKIQPEDWYKPFIIEKPEWIEKAEKNRATWLKQRFGEKNS